MNVRNNALQIVFVLAGLLSFSILPAQVKYDTKWKMVDSLINNKGLTESALTVVNQLYTLARQENNDPQMIRALIFKLNLQEQKQEDPVNVPVQDVEKEIAAARQPARSILQNLLAGVYWSYLQQNRWRFYNRTNTINFVKTDIATWTIDDFHKKIGELYLASLKEGKLLQSTKVDSYDPILVKGNRRYLRPTLYDLLAHEALAYFKSSEADLNRPASVFEIGDPVVFADAGVFARHPFRTEDSLSLHYTALQLFQRLIRLHLSDAAPDALLDVELEKIVFANSYAVLNDKDSLYRGALTRLTDRYGLLPAAAQAWYLLAEDHVSHATERGESEQGEPAESKQGEPGGSGQGEARGNVLARAICEKVLTEKDSSEGRANCQALLSTILKQDLRLETEKVNIPGQPLRCLVSWRNCSRVQFRLIRLNSSGPPVPPLNLYEKNYGVKLLALPVYRSWSQVLPETNDYLTHSSEIAIASLPAGRYALVASNNSAWDMKQGVLAVQYFYVSSIAFVNRERDFFVVDRKSGQPLSGAVTQIWNQVYNNATGSTDLVKAESYTTDQQGHFLMKEQQFNNYHQLVLSIHTPGDELFLSDAPFSGFFTLPVSGDSLLGKEAFEKKNARVFFFLDRSLYRPGQTVFFKGIVVTVDFETRKTKVFQGSKDSVVLYNVNGEKVSSLGLTTNEFGSFHGTFSLPENILNGRFRIADVPSGSSEYFSVEEYKRPKFYVDFEKQKDSYRVNDSIRVTGNVKGYAGNVIDGAKVSYRVVRTARFPNSWFFWRRGAPGSGNQEIAHGTLRSSANGKFSFVYTALPDRSVPVDSDPEFSYAVTVTVTDINGETRTGSTEILAAYSALRLDLSLPGEDRLTADSLKTILVHTTNLSGETVPSKVQLTVYPLQTPGRLIRERLWQAPDRWIVSEKEFLDSFPQDEYRQETKKESWAKGGKFWDTVATGENVAVPRGRFIPGWYVIEASAIDKYGKTVKARHYIELYDSKTGRPASPEYNWVSDRSLTAQPGEKIQTGSGSSANDVFVIRKIERADEQVIPVFGRGKSIHLSNDGLESPGLFSFFTLSGEKKTTEWAVTEADRGGFGVTEVFVKDNRVYTTTSTVAVPWTNKELEIGYATYRDKTLPGSAEKWKVTINGYRKEQVSAEVLMAMYDASLDQFAPHSWTKPYLFPVYGSRHEWQGDDNFGVVRSQDRDFGIYELPVYRKDYDQLLSAYDRGSVHYLRREMATPRTLQFSYDRNADSSPVLSAPGASQQIRIRGTSNTTAMGMLKKDTVEYKASATLGTVIPSQTRGEPGQQQPAVSIRKNFNETAFFFPDLRTDSLGNVSFDFTMPEALTRWKWMTLAHTREAAFGYSEKSILTQKQLMVQPNAPRFLREGDRIELGVKVSNLTDSELTGQMSLQLTDPTTGQTADGWFTNRQPNQYFTVGAGQSAVVAFPLDIPYQYNRPLTYRVVAEARNYSDGEEATLPVVSNRMLVTETLPLNMPGDGTRSFTLQKLLQSGSSETLSQHALTVEFTSNPAWYAVQALPYLMEYPYECAEQTFNRFYANALATKIVNASPRIRQVFASWRTEDTSALLSNLQKNQELKSVLLEETPWVMQGKSEEQQRKNIALLFEMSLMERQLEKTLDQLKGMQLPSGGFVWFKGGLEDRYITQYILTGIGHLQQLNALPSSLADKVKGMVKTALPYLDARIREDYERELAAKKPAGTTTPPGLTTKTGGATKRPGGTGTRIRSIGELQVQYLYMRSLFNDQGIPGSAFAAVNYYRKQAQQSWLQSSRYMQGMIALALFRTGDVQTAKDIIASLRQNAIREEEKGMYWKGMEGGYYWYQAPVETQSLLIEAFHEISGDATIDRELKTWLLKQKQTHSWPTTKATADACYALLLNGTDWLTAERDIEIRLGDKTVSWPGASAGADGRDAGAAPVKTGEAGTGYNKKVFDGPFVNPSMGNITVTLKTLPGSPAGGTPLKGGSTAGAVAMGSPAWGAVYWQYFENLDRITPAENAKAPLKLVKKLFIERNTDRGPVLEPLAENGTLKVGDKVKVRIELQADRDLEYVHMKDMRAACMEPVNVISQYKWQGGLGYYESTKDASTDFFFSTLRRGTYVFEYSLFAGQVGNFSNGTTTIECMYAPEFAFHSEGIRVNVEGN